MFCPKCGSQVEDGSRFCESCGAQMPTPGGPSALPMEEEPFVNATGAPDSAEPAVAHTAKSGGINPAIPIIIIAALLAALVGVGFATHWFGLAGEKGAESSTTGSVSVGQDSSSSEAVDGQDSGGSISPTQSPSATQAASAEKFVITDEVVDPASADGYKVSGTITNNMGEGCNSVALRYDIYYLKKDNYGDEVEDSYSTTKYVYDLPAQTSKNFELLFTSPENAGNIQRVELWSIDADEYTYTSSRKVLTSDEYALEGLSGEDNNYSSVTYKGTIANNTDYKWERVDVEITKIYDKDGKVIWDNHGEHNLDNGYFNEGYLLTGGGSAQYIKNGENADIELYISAYYLPDLSKNQIDHFDVRVTVIPDNG